MLRPAARRRSGPFLASSPGAILESAEVVTIRTTERPAADLANPASAAPTITDTARTRRTLTQPGLHPTGAGATVTAGG